MGGVQLLLFHPEIAGRKCSDCIKYVHDDRPGRMGQIVERPRGVPVLRIKNQRPRCEWCPKVPKDEPPEPSSAVELSDRNWQAYRHYMECRAIGKFPDDPIVRRNAMLIRQAEDQAGEMRQLQGQVRGIVLGMAKVKGG